MRKQTASFSVSARLCHDCTTVTNKIFRGWVQVGASEWSCQSCHLRSSLRGRQRPPLKCVVIHSFITVSDEGPLVFHPYTPHSLCLSLTLCVAVNVTPPLPFRPLCSLGLSHDGCLDEEEEEKKGPAEVSPAALRGLHFAKKCVL